MRLFKLIACVLGGALLVVYLCASVSVMAAPLDTRQAAPTDDPEPTFTRIVTVTLEANLPTATALNSTWEQTILGFPVGPDGFTTTLSLPTDSTAITASISHGEFSIIGTNIQFRLLPGQVDFSWSYHTGQKAVRIGNQYQIDQFARSNTFYRYIGTVFFPAPYAYVGSINYLPNLVTTDTLHWDGVVPETAPSEHTFNASSWFVDPRLAQPDLSFTAAAMSIESNLNPPIAHLTATLRNNNDVGITSTNAILEFYDRASPSTPPSGPLDHEGGWCGSAATPNCPTLPTFSNPVPSLGAGESTTVVMTYPLTRPGLRDYYFQIDTFGGVFGLNYEFDEANNVYTLTRGAVIDYLTSVTISGPLTGTAYTLYTFEAQVSPTLAVSRPITYTWSPAPISGQGTAQAAYTWGDGLSHTITLTARNSHQVVVTDTQLISIEVPLSSASLAGPSIVSRDIPHVYQVSALPITATPPIDYLWLPEPDQGQYTAVATYTLTDLGPQLLTVQLNNPIGPAITVTHAVTSFPALGTVTIGGLSIGRPDTTYLFAATLDPADVALPVSYVWSPAPISGQGTAQAAYRWSTVGLQVINVMVSNDSGPITDTHAISIEIPLTGASIDGPSVVSIDIPHIYTVTLQPANATPPGQYLWSPAPEAGQGTAVVSYTLSELGPNLLTVELTDSTGQPFSATHIVTATQPLAAVTLDGPTTGHSLLTYHFTATIDPADAAAPLYNWSPAPDSGQGTAYTTYHWAVLGAQTITVTVHNDSGSVAGQHSLEITGGYVYLPLVHK